MHKTLDEVEEKDVSLKDVTEEGTLPGEKAKRGGVKKKLLMLAALGALLVGTSLGLLGAGGSILTVPVLVYLAGVPEKLAITSSLAIVAAISAAGAVPFARRREIVWPEALATAKWQLPYPAWAGRTLLK